MRQTGDGRVFQFVQRILGLVAVVAAFFARRHGLATDRVVRSFGSINAA